MSRRIIGVTVGTTISPKAIEGKVNPVKTVNGIEPDENGNVVAGDGYSPTVTLTDINGGVRVTVTDVNGTESTDITAAKIGAAPAVESAEHPGCYYRTVDGATEWVNPPMNVGVEYCTTERWNGKPVYAWLIDAGALPQKSYKNVSYGADVEDVIECRGYASNSENFGCSLPIASSDMGVNINIYALKSGVVTIFTGEDDSYLTAKILVKYTKTTD